MVTGKPIPRALRNLSPPFMMRSSKPVPPVLWLNWKQRTITIKSLRSRRSIFSKNSFNKYLLKHKVPAMYRGNRAPASFYQILSAIRKFLSHFALCLLSLTRKCPFANMRLVPTTTNSYGLLRLDDVISHFIT